MYIFAWAVWVSYFGNKSFIIWKVRKNSPFLIASKNRWFCFYKISFLFDKICLSNYTPVAIISFPCPVSLSVLPVSFSCNDVISGFRFQSAFSVNFLYVEIEVWNLISACRYAVFPACLWRDHPFSSMPFQNFCQKLLLL